MQVMVYLDATGKYAITDNPFVDAIETWLVETGNRWARYGPFTMTTEERCYHFCERVDPEGRIPRYRCDIEREKTERALCCALGVEYRR